MQKDPARAKYYADVVQPDNKWQQYTVEEMITIRASSDNRALAKMFKRTVAGIETCRRNIRRAERQGISIEQLRVMVASSASFEAPTPKPRKRAGYISEAEQNALWDAQEA